ncbi:UNVERIFIED_CONTAM: hypothetical protein FKN15_019902 [Acipenser sinensis]
MILKTKIHYGISVQSDRMQSRLIAPGAIGCDRMRCTIYRGCLEAGTRVFVYAYFVF